MEHSNNSARDKAYEIGPHVDNDLPVALIGVGVALLLAEGFLGLFIMNDITDGHFVIAAWMTIQTLLGFGFIGVGWMKHTKAK
jgi:hypothetical protein